ncbi:hypothetical protein GLYMA_09G160700v4 [Glycine max]|uniref:AT3G52170-like helix-turn-helix domain-containing protein n=1 Tax=Glycine max TaxID=3847 RepID=K7LE83_SOYBN|nr:uncharacterized protein LOC102663456 isoform X3 [Glycine max]KAG4991806.1 hypothetical protein JHK87_025263 [Glycine soja]KAH1043245.1 hypothetical protein GYH30_025209 [Glycine max]KAH1233953.1 hypothetical protein GmHk_09G026276 [Glycine max]KRH38826.1 hypothetical protein GLYMA_09G160700v4 [Glycine max]|eukprot:XP_006587409.1 uncharacterized protein LOC102663456 isoform X3 [Glycine max]
MRKKLLIETTKGLSFCSNRNFTPKPNHLSYEVCFSVDPLKVQQCGWSHAASVPSEEPEAPKGQKRVPRHERRAMVESFVNNYRAENAGKFPRISDTQKQVGGSYYVIREIIQELEYKSKMNSSNSVKKIFVEKQFDESKLLTTESVNVSSGNIEIANESSVQDDSQSVVLDDKESVNTVYEHLEEKRGPQTSYLERRLSDEVEIMSTPSNHCIAPESNTVEKFSKEPCPSSLDMPNDIKTEEVVSTYSDSFAPEHSQEERKHSPLFSENDGTGYDKAQGHEYDFVNMENHQNVEEKCIKKADCERREQPDLEDLSRELLHSSLLEPNDVKSREAVSNSSDSVTQERHPLKEEIDQFSASFIEKSVSSCSEGQSHDSKFVDMEKHSAFVKKSFEKRYERKDQDAVDSLKHKIEQSQRSLEYDESKMNSSNKRETSVVVGSQKSTLWGNLKSFATGIINIWKKS